MRIFRSVHAFAWLLILPTTLTAINTAVVLFAFKERVGVRYAKNDKENKKAKKEILNE